MTRILVTGLFVVAALAGAPHAGADPEDLVPYCSGDQTPIDNSCKTMAHQEFTHNTDAGGLSPNLPSGLNPTNQPVI